MNDVEKLIFYEQLKNLLKGDVKPKSDDVIDGEKFCDSLRKIIADLFEETHKLDVLPDEFNVREFLRDNIGRPISFYEQLANLLKGDVKPKSDDVIDGEKFCDSLRKTIVDLFEETHKLDVFPDEFNLREFLRDNIDRPIERMKEQKEKTWLRDKLTIGLMGHYCTGKTTALNLMFGESFTTNGHENTALATYLTYGSNTNIVTIVDKAGQSQELTLEQCSLFDYAKGVEDFPFARIFNYMVKENKNKTLKDLTIIDTPGLFSTKVDHSVPTMNVVSSCDAIFWFINITDSASKEDISVIHQYVGSLPLYIVFSYVDARGTTPQSVDEAIKKTLLEIKKNEIDCKGFLKLGKRDSVRQQFKSEADAILEKLANEHEAYVPTAHIIEVVNSLEGFLVNCKNNLAEAVANLDSETDKLYDEYKSSCRSFETECNNSTSRFNNMVDTFNNRCNGATFCVGAYSALCNNINSISESLNRMVKAYNSMDESKLVEYGDGVARMNMCQYKLDRVSEILSRLNQLKEQLL